jgi:hypothetical protein
MFGQSIEPDHIYVERRAFSRIKGFVHIPAVERKVYVEVQAPRAFFSQ